jgi:hypothetical protein
MVCDADGSVSIRYELGSSVAFLRLNPLSRPVGSDPVLKDRAESGPGI